MEREREEIKDEIRREIGDIRRLWRITGHKSLAEEKRVKELFVKLEKE